MEVVSVPLPGSLTQLCVLCFLWFLTTYQEEALPETPLFLLLKPSDAQPIPGRLMGGGGSARDRGHQSQVLPSNAAPCTCGPGQGASH